MHKARIQNIYAVDIALYESSLQMATQNLARRIDAPPLNLASAAYVHKGTMINATPKTADLGLELRAGASHH
jgi:hypothetical protein